MTGITPKIMFTDDKKLVVITKEGQYYLVDVDWIKGGECQKLEKKSMIDETEETPKKEEGSKKEETKK